MGVKRTPHLKSSPHWREEKSLLPSGEKVQVEGEGTPRLLTQTPLWERGMFSHIERGTPLTITSPLGGEDEGEGEGDTKTALLHRKRVNQTSHIESKIKSLHIESETRKSVG